MAYKYVSNKFAGSLKKVGKAFDDLKENGSYLKYLQAGEDFQQPILPPLREIQASTAEQLAEIKANKKKPSKKGNRKQTS